MLGGVDLKAAWQPAHDEAVGGFLAPGGDGCLFASADASGRLVLGSALPAEPPPGSHILYVLKNPAATAAAATSDAAANTDEAATAPWWCSCILGILDSSDALGSLQQIMTTLWAPALLAASEGWPDTLHQVRAQFFLI